MTTRDSGLSLVLFGQPDEFADLRIPADASAAGAMPRWTSFIRAAEAARFDAFFKADFLGFDETRIGHDPSLLLEPLAITAALSSVTERIGLVMTASTTFSMPYAVARQVLSLHDVSGGRAGWNAVTSFNGEADFGPLAFGALTDRYERATEFIEVVLRLWDSWDADAVDYRPGAAPTVDPARIHRVEHVGAHFSVEEALDVSRLHADRPVVFQAGASSEGMRFAARFGEAIFVATPDIAHAHDYSDAIRSLAGGFGRPRDSIRVLPGLRTYLGDTEEHALEEYRDVFANPTYYRSRLDWLRREAPFFELHDLELDEVIPAERIPSRALLATHTRRVSRGLLLSDLITETEDVTLRGFLERIHGFGHLDLVGTPAGVADEIARWHAVGASDGFTLMGGNSFSRIVEEVIPLLQERGVFRREYEGTTLRHHLGL